MHAIGTENIQRTQEYLTLTTFRFIAFKFNKIKCSGCEGGDADVEDIDLIRAINLRRRFG